MIFHRWIISCRRNYAVIGPCKLGTREVLIPVLQPCSQCSILQEFPNKFAAKPETKTTLPKVLAHSMLPHFLAPVIPRLSLIVFRYAQPVLISTAIRSMSKPSSQSSETEYSVILMAVIVYVGLAASLVNPRFCVTLVVNLQFSYPGHGTNTA